MAGILSSIYDAIADFNINPGKNPYDWYYQDFVAPNQKRRALEAQGVPIPPSQMAEQYRKYGQGGIAPPPSSFKSGKLQVGSPHANARIAGAMGAAGMPDARSEAIARVQELQGQPPTAPAGPSPQPPMTMGQKFGQGLMNPALPGLLHAMAQPGGRGNVGGAAAQGAQWVQQQQQQKSFADYLEAQGKVEEAALVRNGSVSAGAMFNHMNKAGMSLKDKVDIQKKLADMANDKEAARREEARFQGLDPTTIEKTKIGNTLAAQYMGGASDAAGRLIEHLMENKTSGSGSFAKLMEKAGLSTVLSETQALLVEIETNIGANALKNIRDGGGTLGQVTIGEWERLGGIYGRLDLHMSWDKLVAVAQQMRDSADIARQNTLGELNKLGGDGGDGISPEEQAFYG